MISSDEKATIEAVAAVASAASAIIALAIAVWVFIEQNRLQRQQLRQDLFDKRFAVYAAVETFMMSIIQSDTIINMNDHRKFLYAIEPAEFLFGADVAAYLREIREFIAVLSERQQAEITQNSCGEDALPLSTARTTIIETMALYERRNQVFRPYLLIHDE